MITLDKLDAELRNSIESITELDTDKVYLLELPSMPMDVFCKVGENMRVCFNSVGVKCIITLEGVIKNIYKLEGCEEDDSGTSIK